jgi:hypothetical protein
MSASGDHSALLPPGTGTRSPNIDYSQASSSRLDHDDVLVLTASAIIQTLRPSSFNGPSPFHGIPAWGFSGIPFVLWFPFVGAEVDFHPRHPGWSSIKR